MKVNQCRCGREPHVCQWPDTVRPNATWIECDCGMMTDTRYDSDPEIAKELVTVIWNGGE